MTSATVARKKFGRPCVAKPRDRRVTTLVSAETEQILFSLAEKTEDSVSNITRQLIEIGIRQVYSGEF